MCIGQHWKELDGIGQQWKDLDGWCWFNLFALEFGI
jgi:hypothetical protein